MAAETPHVSIILVNYNGEKDTVHKKFDRNPI